MDDATPAHAVARRRPAAPRGTRLVVAVAIAAIVAAAAALAGVPARATYGAQTTADEPQYLLTALSLARDGDLDISDELAARDWRAFHAAELPQQTRPLPGGVRISPHDPLLPVVLAPGVGLAGWVGGKLTLVLAAAVLAGLLVWTAVVRLRVPAGVATVTVTVFAAAVPLAPYGSQVYPELPAALAVAAALAALLGPTSRSGAALVVAACCALPWLGIKYAPVAAVLALALLVRLLRAGRRDGALLALGALAVAGAAYLVVHQSIWTGWTPYASGDHFVVIGEAGVVGAAPDWWARTTRLPGLLVERSFGLAAWQPAWLLVVPAVAAAVRAGMPGRPTLLGVLGLGWLTASYVALTMAGWWVPGRQLVVVTPAAILVIAWWAGRHRAAAVAVAGLGAIGVASWLLLAWEASTGRLTLVVDFFATANPWYRLWRLALPDYLAPSAATWWRHAIWLVALAGLAALGWWSAGRGTTPGEAVASARDAQDDAATSSVR